jgi:O-antigen ligase
MRWIAAALTAWLFVDAALSVPQMAAASHFGDPPVQALLWAVAGLGWFAALLRASDRDALARRLTLVLLVAALLGERGVPADPGLVVALLGLALLAAGPRLLELRAASPWIAAACLVLVVPGLLGSSFPHGALLWLLFSLPAFGLLVLLPALFPGRRAATAVLVLLVATAAFSLLSMWSYVELAGGLDLPLMTLAGTRLHVMGLHPNLAVPLLVAASLLGLALATSRAGTPRRIALACLAPTIAALLCVRSRTGLLALLLGTLLLASLRLPRRARTWAPRLAALAVAALLLLPLAGLGETRLTARTGSMVSKAASFRSAMWELGRDTLTAAPWHGFGPGTLFVQGRFALAGPLDGHPKDDHPHSVVLAVGEAFGWPGLAALALLFAAALRGPREDDRLGAGLQAALLAVFAANAIDLGGAQNTLFPALVLILLGLAEAARQPDELPARVAADPAAAARRARRLVAPCAVVIAFGLLSWGAAAAKQRAADRLAHDQDPGGALALAARLAPLDPEVPVLAAQQAAAQHDREERVAELVRARERLPGSSALAQQLAAACAAIDPADPQVDTLLDEALRLDPLGDRAWTLHRDRAIVFALRDEPAAALDSLLNALLVNPAAASELPRAVHDGALTIFPAGEAHAGVPLAALRAELAQRRAQAAHDPGEALRLALREVELLVALQAWDEARAAARELLAGESTYLPLRLASIAMASGHAGEAVEPLREMAPQRLFWAATDLVEALAQAPETTPAEFESALETVLGLMRAGEADAWFDLPSVIDLLQARQAWAERQGDAVTAVRCAEAVEFARR